MSVISLKLCIASRPAGKAANTATETTTVIAKAPTSRYGSTELAASQGLNVSIAAREQSDAQNDGAIVM